MAQKRKHRAPEKLSAKPKGLSASDSKAYDEALAASVSSNGWKPESPGEVLIGKLVARRDVPTQHGTVEAADIETDSEGVKCVLLGSVLAREFERVKPRLGDRLVIVYRGMYDSGKKGRNPARLFSLAKSGKQRKG